MAPEDSDEARVQGKWMEVEAYIYGTRTERVSAAFTFSNGEMVMQYRNPELDDRPYRYEIDETAVPPRLDILFRYDDADDWSVTKGIYKLDGDTMIWCQSLTGFHPEDFDPGGPDDLKIVVKLERAN